MSDEFTETQRHEDEHPDPGNEPGSEGQASKDKLPLQPAKDDETPLGDTDQHSGADA